MKLCGNVQTRRSELFNKTPEEYVLLNESDEDICCTSHSTKYINASFHSFTELWVVVNSSFVTLHAKIVEA